MEMEGGKDAGKMRTQSIYQGNMRERSLLVETYVSYMSAVACLTGCDWIYLSELQIDPSNEGETII